MSYSSRRGKSPPIVADGKALRDRGVRRAIENHPAAVLETQLAMLRAVAQNGRASIDDITPADFITGKFAARGPWRGAAVSGLVARNLIRSVGWVPSARRHRHYGFNRQFEAVSLPRVRAAITETEQHLAALLAGGAK